MKYFRNVRYVAGIGLLALGAAACVPDAPTETVPPSTTPDPVCVPEGASVTNGEATLTVSQVNCLEVGNTVTVSGSGYTTTGNLGTRPPLPSLPAGVYVMVGEFEDTWRPSEGAPSTARKPQAQLWAVPADSYAQAPALQGNATAFAFDGSFSVELTVGELENAETHPVLAVATYPAGGSTNAAEEIRIPLSLDG